MKNENNTRKEYKDFQDRISTGMLSLQENFDVLKSAFLNLSQNLPEEEKDAFVVKFTQISETFEMMFNRYNQIK